MRQNKYPGKFIVFEGLDGSGSSTQAEKLVAWLKSQKIKAALAKEPTNNIVGGLIRGQLTHDWKSSQECLQLLFAADRAHHLEKEIIPLLQSGVWVICDRYLFSTVAFGSLEIPEKDWLLSLNERFIMPDLTIILKVSPENCIKRMEDSRFSIELFETRDKLSRVWRAYQWLNEKFFDYSVVIDGQQNIAEVAKKVETVVTDKILKYYKPKK
ncbi:MAG: dTMP kinase [Candidatus Buchananbacteria bacterium]